MQIGGCTTNGLTKYCNPTDSFAWLGFAGQFFGVIGTSISAPDFAGVLTLKAQYMGQRLGNVNYDIYQAAANQASSGDLLHQNQNGFNGYYATIHNHFNFVLGVENIVGASLIGAPQLPSAGNPKTPSNP